MLKRSLLSAPPSAAVAQGALGTIATASVTLPDAGSTLTVPFGATDGPKVHNDPGCSLIS